IETIKLDEEAPERVQRPKEPENHAWTGKTVEHGDQHAENEQVQHELIANCWMDGLARLAEGVGMNVHHGPRQIGCCTMVLAVDDVAEATDGHAQDQADCPDVEQFGHREASAPGVNRTDERAANDRAENRQPALVDLHDRDGILRVVAPLIDDVDEPRADDASNHSP